MTLFTEETFFTQASFNQFRGNNKSSLQLSITRHLEIFSSDEYSESNASSMIIIPGDFDIDSIAGGYVLCARGGDIWKVLYSIFSNFI